MKVELSRGVYLFRAAANVTLVTEPEVTLFDAGSSRDGPRLLRALQALGIPPERIQKIVLTHSDWRHAGGAHWLAQTTGAEVFSSQSAAAILGHHTSPGKLRILRATLFGRRTPVVQPSILQENDEVAGFRVIEVPGHTAGSLAFFRPSDGILVVGDAARVAGMDILPPDFWRSSSELVGRRSLGILAQLPTEILIPGHGPAYRLPQQALRAAAGPPGFADSLITRRAERARSARHS